ncbi:unnamed protein product [Amaranthus hypochondriacus]
MLVLLDCHAVLYAICCLCTDLDRMCCCHLLLPLWNHLDCCHFAILTVLICLLLVSELIWTVCAASSTYFVHADDLAVEACGADMVNRTAICLCLHKLADILMCYKGRSWLPHPVSFQSTTQHQPSSSGYSASNTTTTASPRSISPPPKLYRWFIFYGGFPEVGLRSVRL